MEKRNPQCGGWGGNNEQRDRHNINTPDNKGNGKQLETQLRTSNIMTQREDLN